MNTAEMAKARVIALEELRQVAALPASERIRRAGQLRFADCGNWRPDDLVSQVKAVKASAYFTAMKENPMTSLPDRLALAVEILESTDAGF